MRQASLLGAGFALLVLAWIARALEEGVWLQVSSAAVGLSLVLFFAWRNRRLAWALARTRGVRENSLVLLACFAVAVALGLVNFVGQRHRVRIDLTENRIFSLSDETVKVARRVPEELNVYAFFKAPSREFDDLMPEYRALNPKIKYRMVDPQMEPALAQKFQVVRFGEVVFQLKDRHAKIDTLIDPLTEEKVTNAILKVVQNRTRHICFLVGHGERSIVDQGATGLSLLREKIENQNFTLSGVALQETAVLPENCDVLVLAGPQVAFSPEEASRLASYLDRGGRLVALMDPQVKIGLDGLFRKAGVILRDDVVIDHSGVGRLFGIGPAAPAITQYEDHPITRGFQSSLSFFPMARSLEPVSTPGIRSVPLVKTRQSSWGETELKEGKDIQFDRDKDAEGPLVLALVNQREPAGARPIPFLVLFGDSDFATNAYFQRQRNGDLILNSINWLAEAEDLVTIRPKDPAHRRIELTERQSRMVHWLSLMVLPALPFAVGLMVWMRRRP
ncbi:MAG: GldG family protein [Acidobacteria bacterium]|nr:GldG family protein [Acidobacteriota bacterium]